jgi:lysophospholipase L1-like esterase
MSVTSRIRTRVLACCVISVAAIGALILAPTAGAAKVGSTYLALGDSLAYGFHQAQFESEFPAINPGSFNDGYVDDFGATLKLFHPSLETINDGCPGETTETMIKGSGIPGFCAGGPTGTPFPDVWLHHPYPARGSQLADALAILAANSNVSPITLDIGANDLIQFDRFTCGFPATFTCTEAQVAAELGHIAANVYSILVQLRAAAPHAQIVLMGIYNAFPAVVKPDGTGDKAIAAFNAAEASVAAKVPGTSFANPLPLFNPSGSSGGPETGDIPTICAFTAMCPGGVYNPASPKADIHPSKLGYAVLAGDVGFTFATH